jgi:hypothetical protein
LIIAPFLVLISTKETGSEDSKAIVAAFAAAAAHKPVVTKRRRYTVKLSPSFISFI